MANYLNEWHVGYTGRELSLGGSTFDLRLDYMPKSDVRQPQLVIEVLTQKLFGMWAFSAISLGPSAVFANTDSGNFGLLNNFCKCKNKSGNFLLKISYRSLAAASSIYHSDIPSTE